MALFVSCRLDTFNTLFSIKQIESQLQGENRRWLNERNYRLLTTEVLTSRPPLTYNCRGTCADHLPVFCTNGSSVDRQNCITVSYIPWVEDDFYN